MLKRNGHDGGPALRRVDARMRPDLIRNTFSAWPFMLAPELLSYTASPGQGFHSTLTAGLRLDEPAPTCSAFVLYTLPPSIIVDRYELSDRGIDFELWGESNLELPVFAVSQTHTRLLVKVAARSDEVLVNLPVHARYGVPFTGDPMLQSIEIPPPATFWACPQSGMPY